MCIIIFSFDKTIILLIILIGWLFGSAYFLFQILSETNKCIQVLQQCKLVIAFLDKKTVIKIQNQNFEKL